MWYFSGRVNVKVFIKVLLKQVNLHSYLLFLVKWLKPQGVLTYLEA